VQDRESQIEPLFLLFLVWKTFMISKVKEKALILALLV